MELQDIVNVMLTQRVTAEEFRNFFVRIGLQDDPWVVQILQDLILAEVSRNNNWNTNVADHLLDNLPGPSSGVGRSIAPNDTTSLRVSRSGEFK